jgi:hypothetical protein
VPGSCESGWPPPFSWIATAIAAASSIAEPLSFPFGT